jgi:tRNA threonylcarbamoyladenosine biosynthesis protein TsaB
MLTLGISSADSITQVALVEDGEVLSEHSSNEGIRTEDLIGHIDHAFKKAGRKIEDISGIAVTIGPGSYGGLRGALATAKGLAAPLNIPVAGVATLDAVSRNFEGMEGLVLAALPALKDEFNAALFAVSGKAVKRLTDDFVITRSRLTEFMSSVLGEITLAESGPKLFASARNVALIGETKLQNGEASDALSLVPQYSHDPNIREYKKGV